MTPFLTKDTRQDDLKTDPRSPTMSICGPWEMRRYAGTSATLLRYLWFTSSLQWSTAGIRFHTTTQTFLTLSMLPGKAGLCCKQFRTTAIAPVPGASKQHELVNIKPNLFLRSKASCSYINISLMDGDPQAPVSSPLSQVFLKPQMSSIPSVFTNIVTSM